MQKEHTLVALFDAHPEHAHFASPILAGRARALGSALKHANIGIVARPGSPFVATVLDSLDDDSEPSIVLSPASSRDEHEKAYRLPHVVHQTIFTGRGALGADKMAIASADGIIIAGSYENVLENIIAESKGHGVPIGILSDEEPSEIHVRIRALNPKMAIELFVSHDPAILVKEISNEIRRRRLEKKRSHS